MLMLYIQLLLKRAKENCFYADSIYELLSIYKKAMMFLKNNDEASYCMFEVWFQSVGYDDFDYVLTHITQSKIDERLNAFTELYGTYLKENMNKECLIVLLEFLHIIPGKMKRDFQNFGFLEDRPEIDYMGVIDEKRMD